MSNPGRYDFKIFAGQTVDMAFFWKGPDGTPISTDGFTFSFVAKLSHRAATQILNKDLVIEEDGRIALHITDEETATLEMNCLVYTIKAENLGNVYPLMYGNIDVSKEIF